MLGRRTSAIAAAATPLAFSISRARAQAAEFAFKFGNNVPEIYPLNVRVTQAAGEPFRFAHRPGVLRCRKCRRDVGLTAATVMERTHTPLSARFWAAYLVASQTPGMSAMQFQRQIGLSRYGTASQILHKLRAGMVRPDQDRIGGRADEHVEVDEAYIGGRTRGKGRGVTDQVLVASAVEVRQREPCMGTGEKFMRLPGLPGNRHPRRQPYASGARSPYQKPFVTSYGPCV